MEMRSPNPFWPEFGTPRHFFGRYSILELLRTAMEPGRRPNRSLIIDGMRGTGKTALLGRLRTLAGTMGWEVASTTSAGEPTRLTRSLAAQKKRTPRTFSLNVTTPVGSAGVTLSFGDEITSDLSQTLLAHLRTSKRGMLILLDEAQKLSAPYAQEVCVALNEAREEGFDVALVAAGLPGTYRRISRFDRCTFMARSLHFTLPMLTASETREAFTASFLLVPEVEAAEEIIEAAAEWTCGHPYLVQLMGDSLYRQAAEVITSLPGTFTALPLPLTDKMLQAAEDDAWSSYATNVLDLVFSDFGQGTLSYLRALAGTMDSGIMTSGAEVAQKMGKNFAKEVSTYRFRLIQAGILRNAGYGKLAFTIPYVKRYLEEGPPLPPDQTSESYFQMR